MLFPPWAPAASFPRPRRFVCAGVFTSFVATRKFDSNRREQNKNDKQSSFILKDCSLQLFEISHFLFFLNHSLTCWFLFFQLSWLCSLKFFYLIVDIVGIWIKSTDWANPKQLKPTATFQAVEEATEVRGFKGSIWLVWIQSTISIICWINKCKIRIRNKSTDWTNPKQLKPTAVFEATEVRGFKGSTRLNLMDNFHHLLNK